MIKSRRTTAHLQKLYLVKERGEMENQNQRQLDTVTDVAAYFQTDSFYHSLNQVIRQ